MPRDHAKRPVSTHWGEIEEARKDPASQVFESAFPFATAAQEGRLKAQSPLDAVTMSFAAAVDRVLRGREAQLRRGQPDARQPSRTSTAALARQLGMSGESLRLTRSGDRWATLRDVLTALERRDDIGRVLDFYLQRHLRPWPYLLHKGGPEHPTLTPARAAQSRASTCDSVESASEQQTLTEARVMDLERTARDAITLLAAAQARVEATGRALPSEVDWQAVAKALNPYPDDDEPPVDEPERPRPGKLTPGAKTLAEYGISNMNAAVLDVFRDGQPHSAAHVIKSVRGHGEGEQIDKGLEVEPVPDDAIRNALWRLHSRPKDPSKRWLVHEEGTYKPGPRMIREHNQEGNTEKP